MKYNKDAEGWYDVEGYKTKLCPVDSTNLTTWGQSLIQKGQDAIDNGFGLCHDGTPYDLSNFLCDTLGGNVPWDTEQYIRMYLLMKKEPNFVQVMTDFNNKYGREYFHLTLEEEMAEFYNIQ